MKSRSNLHAVANDSFQFLEVLHSFADQVEQRVKDAQAHVINVGKKYSKGIMT